MTTIVDGTTGITFPSTISGASANQQYSSKILQVIQGTSTSWDSTTSTTPVATSLSASITPTSASSRILVRIEGSLGWSGQTGTNNFYFRIYRNGSQIYAFNNFNTGGLSQWLGMHGFQYIDSPASTSSTTYALYFNIQASGSAYGQANVHGDYSTSVITLMEIAP